MTIAAVCDGCGDLQGHDRENPYEIPDGWILVEGVEEKHFCSWECAGIYVTQRIREEEAGPSAEEAD